MVNCVDSDQNVSEGMQSDLRYTIGKVVLKNCETLCMLGRIFMFYFLFSPENML